MQNTSKLDYSDQDIFIGCDVHKNSWSATFTTEHSCSKAIRFEPPFVDKMAVYLNKRYPNGNYHLVYEAGFSGFWIKRALDSLGIKTIVVNPADIPLTSKDRAFKNDSRDSRKLALSLKSGELQGIHCPTVEEEKDRNVYRVRNQIAKLERVTKSRIRSLLFQFGYTIPIDKDSRHWPKRLVLWLEQLATKEQLIGLEEQLKTLNVLRERKLSVMRKLRELSRSEKQKEICEILRSMPGVGHLTSIKLKLELIEMERFNSTDQLLAYIGLIPTTRISGEKQRVGKMTKRGKGDLRRTIIESAWTAVRIDPYLRSKYENWCATKQSNKAIVKVAVVMVRMLRYMWLNKELYKPPQGV